MMELEHLLAEAGRLVRERQPFAFATVVKVEGSAYRRPGARMLITRQGTTCGVISGGCLEGEAALRALEAMERGEPRLLVFDLADDDPLVGFGAGCGGSVHVLIEPVEADAPSGPLALLEQVLGSEQSGVLVTVLTAEGREAGRRFQRMLRLEDGTTVGELADSPFAEALQQEAARTLREGRGNIRRFTGPEGDLEVFFEIVRPAIRLVLFGDGHDVAPVVRFGKALGWRVTVVGDRTQEELSERFPQADERIFLMHPHELPAYVRLGGRSAAVVMNHNYLRDCAVLEQLLATAVPYIGVLGPRRRTNLMLEEIAGRGAAPDAARQAALHGPVGLDIGAETPEEIALAIVAEIQAVFSGRSGGMLRDREGAIH